MLPSSKRVIKVFSERGIHRICWAGVLFMAPWLSDGVLGWGDLFVEAHVFLGVAFEPDYVAG
jgi:hypothetical protein